MSESIVLVLACLAIFACLCNAASQSKGVSLQNVSSSEMSDKWIVVTTIQAPTEDMKSLNAITGWKLVVIGDKKTPKDWQLEGAIYLDVEAQEKLPYKAVKVLPYSSYARKNVGYLYAIHHGAKYVYETDDDNRLVSLDIFQFTGDYHGLRVHTDSPAVNPYSHFGQSTIWPRGYPLELLGQTQPRTYTFGKTKVPVIQQGVVDADPDVDALFRLTRKPLDMMVNVTFDAHAPAILLPPNTFSPFNSQNTLFLYDALSLLMLPISVTYRETDIYRSYWAQKLLSLIGYSMIFTPPKTIQIRNMHNFVVDAKQELKIYFNTGRYAKFLNQWECKKDTFFECIYDLTAALVTEEIYGKADLDLVSGWLEDLKSFGYKQPKLIKAGESDLHSKTSVTFYPNEQETCMPNTKYNILPAHSTNVKQLTALVEDKCGSYLAKKHTHELQHNKEKVKNLLLVVPVQGDLKRIVYLETIYKFYFSHILYCGKEALDLSISGISYIRVDHPNVLSCVENAVKMDYNVKSIVYVSGEKYLSAPVGTRNKVVQLLQENHPRYRELDASLLHRLAGEVTIEKNGCDPVENYIVALEKSNFVGFLQVLDKCEDMNCLKKLGSLLCDNKQLAASTGRTNANSVVFLPLSQIEGSANHITYCQVLDNLQ